MSTVIEAFLQKKKRTPAAVSGVWHAVDYRYKLHPDSFTVMPGIQWETATKVRIALWDKSDVAVFIVKVAPQLPTTIFSMSDERTRILIDEREVISVQSGSSSYSTRSLTAAAAGSKPNLLVDVPDHPLKLDVEGLVRQALRAKGIVQGVDNVYPLNPWIGL